MNASQIILSSAVLLIGETIPTVIAQPRGSDWAASAQNEVWARNYLEAEIARIRMRDEATRGYTPPLPQHLQNQISKETHEMFSFEILNLPIKETKILINNRLGFDINNVVITIKAKTEPSKEYIDELQFLKSSPKKEDQVEYQRKVSEIGKVKTYKCEANKKEIMSSDIKKSDKTWMVPFSTHFFDENGKSPVSNVMTVEEVFIDGTAILASSEKEIGKIQTWTKKFKETASP